MKEVVANTRTKGNKKLIIKKKKTMKKTVALRNLYRNEFVCYNKCHNNKPTKGFILDSTRVTRCISLQHIPCELRTVSLSPLYKLAVVVVCILLL